MCPVNLDSNHHVKSETCHVCAFHRVYLHLKIAKRKRIGNPSEVTPEKAD
jgi:hypothetical protein